MCSSDPETYISNCSLWPPGLPSQSCDLFAIRPEQTVHQNPKEFTTNPLKYARHPRSRRLRRTFVTVCRLCSTWLSGRVWVDAHYSHAKVKQTAQLVLSFPLKTHRGSGFAKMGHICFFLTFPLPGQYNNIWLRWCSEISSGPRSVCRGSQEMGELRGSRRGLWPLNQICPWSRSFFDYWITLIIKRDMDFGFSNSVRVRCDPYFSSVQQKAGIACDEIPADKVKGP